MSDLREQLRSCLQGRVCLMGLGNVLYADDGLGVRLAEAMATSAVPEPEFTTGNSDPAVRPGLGLRTLGWGLHCLVAGTNPERCLGRVAERGFDNLVFLDAVEFGGVPGSVILLDCEQMTSRFPQVSTHKISLGLLARWVEANGATKVWLLGVQPESLAPGAPLSPAVEATLEMLRALLAERLRGGAEVSTNSFIGQTEEGKVAGPRARAAMFGVESLAGMNTQSPFHANS